MSLKALQGARIARTIETFLPNVTGPVRQSFEIAAALERAGIRSPVYCPRIDVPATAPAEESIGGVEVHRLDESFRISRYAVTPSLPRMLEGADLVHAHNLRNAQTDLAWRFCLARRVPLVVHAHGGLEGFRHYRMGLGARAAYRVYDQLILARVLGHAGAILVSSEAERREALAGGLPAGKVEVVPPGVRCPEALPQRGGDPGSLRLLSVGRLCALRRPELLVEALVSLPSARLTLVGAPARMSAWDSPITVESLRDLAVRRGVSDRLDLPGALWGEALEKVWASADLFLYASRYESFGLPLLEAAARGLPLVTTKVGVAPEILREGETGAYTDGTAADLALQVRTLSASSPWEAAARQARDFVRPRHSWEAAAETCAGIYARLLGKA